MPVNAVFKRNRPATAEAVLVHTVADGFKASLTVNIAAVIACKVRLAVTNGAAPADADWIEVGQDLAIGGVLVRDRIILPSGFRIYAQTTVANSVNVQVWGLEESN